MTAILVSACLVGQPTRYDGRAAPFHHPLLDRWREEGWIVAFCPETAGGLTTPRTPAEIVGGDGHGVLAGQARVVDRDGRDVSREFIQGARAALAIARSRKIALALLKGNSPSCGNRTIYDGSFTGRLQPGHGVAAALLMQHGVPIFNEKQIQAANALIVPPAQTKS